MTSQTKSKPDTLLLDSDDQSTQSDRLFHETNNRYQAMYETSQDAIMILDLVHGFLDCNPATLALFSIGSTEEFQACSPASLSPMRQPDGALSDDKAAQMIATAMKCGSHFFEWTHQDLSGRSFPCTVLLTYMNIQGEDSLQATVRDISANKLAERELRETTAMLEATQQKLNQADKMASLGQLAAGVAHEINNPMAFIQSNLSTMTEYMASLSRLIDAFRDLNTSVPNHSQKAEEPLRATVKELWSDLDVDFLVDDAICLLNESLQGAERIKNIVSGLKDFALTEAPEAIDANINQGIKATVEDVCHGSDLTFDLITDLGDLPQLRCRPERLNQVFANLLENAVQSVEEKGVITVSTSVRGGEICVEIADTGCGMSSDVMKKLFDPFFSTRDVGSGTGLGLSVAHGIVHEHHGIIDVTSELGAGSCFTVRLPLTGLDGP